MGLIEEIGFDHSFSFIFSARPGTPAADLPDDTPMEVKKDRLARLQALINHQAMVISRQMVGKTESVLVTGVSKKIRDNSRAVPRIIESSISAVTSRI